MVRKCLVNSLQKPGAVPFKPCSAGAGLAMTRAKKRPGADFQALFRRFGTTGESVSRLIETPFYQTYLRSFCWKFL